MDRQDVRNAAIANGDHGVAALLRKAEPTDRISTKHPNIPLYFQQAREAIRRPRT